MTKKDIKISAKDMETFCLGLGTSLGEVKRTFQAYKYEDDKIFSVLESMSEDKAEHPFIVPLSDWSGIQKDAFLAFSLLRPEVLKVLFDEKQNPLYVWRAYHNCREHKIPIPDWVLTYLDSSAGELLDIVDSKDPAHETYAAVGFNRKGRGNLYKRFYEDEKRFKAVCQVVDLTRNKEKEKPRKKIDVYDEVAERFEVEIETIKKWCQEYMHLFIPPK